MHARFNMSSNVIEVATEMVGSMVQSETGGSQHLEILFRDVAPAAKGIPIEHARSGLAFFFRASASVKPAKQRLPLQVRSWTKVLPGTLVASEIEMAPLDLHSGK